MKRDVKTKIQRDVSSALREGVASLRRKLGVDENRGVIPPIMCRVWYSDVAVCRGLAGEEALEKNNNKYNINIK